MDSYSGLYNLLATVSSACAVIFNIVLLGGLARETREYIKHNANSATETKEGVRSRAGDKFGLMWFFTWTSMLIMIASVFFCATGRIAKTGPKVTMCAFLAMIWGIAVNYCDRIPDSEGATMVSYRKLVSVSDTLVKENAVMAAGLVGLSILIPAIILGASFSEDE